MRFDIPYRHIDMLYFKNVKSFNKQSLRDKIVKYLLSIKHLWVGITSEAIVYTSDIEILALAIVIKKIKRSNCNILYHQFEAIEKERANALKRFSLDIIKRLKGIDLALFPEKNRLELFKNLIDDESLNTLLFPNTCYPKSSYEFDSTSEGRIRIGHIGSLSGEAFYLNEFLEAARAAKADSVDYIFVGIRDEALKLQILKALPGAEIVGWIDHGVLENIYRSLSVGLILYKPLDFNTAFCAPNKLYEYWSYGIPVIAPNLPGLVPVFDSPQKGKLIDFTQPALLKSVIQNVSQFQRNKKAELIESFSTMLGVEVFIEKLERYIRLLR